MAGWRGEFGADYAVPAWVEEHPELTDTSWHNDTAPTFETGVNAPGYPDNVRIRLWVEHVDPDQREVAGVPRYMLQLMGNSTDTEEPERHCDGVVFAETDDRAVIEALIRWAQGLIARHGISMCPIATELADHGIFPAEDEYLFDEKGTPNFPTLPAVMEQTQAHVDAALQAINRKRAQTGQRPLEPQRADWSDQDILDEAARIRLKNRLQNEGAM